MHLFDACVFVNKLKPNIVQIKARPQAVHDVILSSKPKCSERKYGLHKEDDEIKKRDVRWQETTPMLVNKIVICRFSMCGLTKLATPPGVEST